MHELGPAHRALLRAGQPLLGADAGLEQRVGGHDGERRAGRELARQRIALLVQALGADREDLARVALHRDQRARLGVGHRLLGRPLRGPVDRGLHRDVLAAGPLLELGDLLAGLEIEDDDLGLGRAGQVVLVGLLQPALADRVAGPLRASQLLLGLGGERAHAAHDLPGRIGVDRLVLRLDLDPGDGVELRLHRLVARAPERHQLHELLGRRRPDPAEQPVLGVAGDLGQPRDDLFCPVAQLGRVDAGDVEDGVALQRVAGLVDDRHARVGLGVDREALALLELRMQHGRRPAHPPHPVDQVQRQHPVVFPQGVVLAQVDLGVEVGLGLLALDAQAGDLEAERGRVELQLGVGQRLAHGRRIAVGAAGGQLVVLGLPAHEEVTHRVVRRWLLEAAGQRGARDRQGDGRGQGTAGASHRLRCRRLIGCGRAGPGPSPAWPAAPPAPAACPSLSCPGRCRSRPWPGRP